MLRVVLVPVHTPVLRASAADMCNVGAVRIFCCRSYLSRKCDFPVP